jgi:hypothetical protein
MAVRVSSLEEAGPMVQMILVRFIWFISLGMQRAACQARLPFYYNGSAGKTQPENPGFSMPDLL